MDCLLKTADGRLDLALQPGDLMRDQGLQTSVLNSLFCDARDTEAPAGTDPRGWWGDLDGDEWGSKLWTLLREVASAENAERARQYSVAALDWMVEDGIVETVEVAAEYQSSGNLHLDVLLTRGSSTQWQHAWEALNNQYDVGGVTLQLRTAL